MIFAQSPYTFAYPQFGTATAIVLKSAVATGITVGNTKVWLPLIDDSYGSDGAVLNPLNIVEK